MNARLQDEPVRGAVKASRQRGKTCTLAFTVAFLLSFVALVCAGGAAASRTTTSDTPSLNVAIAVTGTPFTPVYLAQSLGYFAQAGVSVKFINNASATGVALLTSHQADLFIVGPGAVFSLNQQGLPTKIIYNMDSGGTGSVEVLGSSPAKSLMDLAGKRVGTLTVGGSSYGDASAYSNYIVQHGGAAMQLIPFGNQTAVINALMSGQVDATVDSRSWFATQLTNGQVRLAVNTADVATVKKLGVIPHGISETGVFGLDDVLKQKRSTVVRFLQAVAKGAQYVQAHTPAQIATSLASLPDFAGLTVDGLTLAETFDKPFLSPNYGTVTPGTWNQQLASYAEWGLQGINVTPTAFPYNEVVDMSYLYSALSSIPRTFIAHKGDTLRSISQLAYGTPAKGAVIKAANKSLKKFGNFTRVKNRTKLTIPAIQSLAAAVGG
jgi:ABC-type nitrate/sulfonate/bicarbonate transport system substrate-binding protein